MKQARDIAPDQASLDQAFKMTVQFAKLTQEKAAEAQHVAKAEAIAAEHAAKLTSRAFDATAVGFGQNLDRIFSVSDLTVERSIAPAFPRRAAASQKEGWIELNFRIDSLGQVFGASVVRSSDAIFEGSALSVIRKWRFAPYLSTGVATPVRSGVRFSFRQ